MEACNSGDVDTAYNLFLSQYKSIYEKAFPMSCPKRKTRQEFKQPWMTKGLLKSTKKRHRFT
jgi:hypothetical protein